MDLNILINFLSLSSIIWDSKAHSEVIILQEQAVHIYVQVVYAVPELIINSLSRADKDTILLLKSFPLF